MKSILKTILLLPAFCFLFFSCTKDDATKLSLPKQDIALKVGQSDTLALTIDYSGDEAKVPVTVTVSDSKIASAEVLTAGTNSGSASSFTRSLVIKALSPGTASVVIQAGTKKLTCPATITQTSLVFNQSVVLNYGLAVETCDNNVFLMYLFPETFELDRENSSFTGRGQFIHFESFLPVSSASLTAGTFSAGEYGEVNSFLPGGYYTEDGQEYRYGTYIETIEKNQETYTLVKSGTYTISTEGSTYRMEGDLITETNEIVHFSYTGEVTVEDKTEKPQVITPQFTKGDLFYAGDYYNMGFSNTFFAYLETNNVDLNSDVLDGEVLILQINAYDYCKTYVPTGNYKVLTQAKYEDFAVSPLTLVPGNFHLYRGEPVTGGCWYYDPHSRRRLISGNAEVTYESDNYYIKYSLFDRIGSEVRGSFSGKFNFKSVVSSAPAKVKSVQPEKLSPVAALDKRHPNRFGLIHEQQLRPVEIK